MLTPIEIHNKEHKHGRGYSKKEMDEFLDEISEDYETLYKENRDLKEKLEKLSEGIQYYKNLEATLQKALVLAERTSKETIDTANEKAELIQKEAKYKAEQIVNKGITTYESIRQQCISLMQQYSQFKLQFKQIAMKQLELFESDFYEIHTKDFMAQINAAVDTFTYSKDETTTDDTSSNDSVVTTVKSTTTGTSDSTDGTVTTAKSATPATSVSARDSVPVATSATADASVSTDSTVTTAKSATPATSVSARDSVPVATSATPQSNVSAEKSDTVAAKNVSANKIKLKRNTPSNGLTEITADSNSGQSDFETNNTGDTKEIPDIKSVMTDSSTTVNNQTAKDNVTKTADSTTNQSNNNASDNTAETEEDPIESMIRGLRNELSGNISDLQQDNNSPFEYLN